MIYILKVLLQTLSLLSLSILSLSVPVVVVNGASFIGQQQRRRLHSSIIIPSKSKNNNHHHSFMLLQQKSSNKQQQLRRGTTALQFQINAQRRNNRFSSWFSSSLFDESEDDKSEDGPSSTTYFDGVEELEEIQCVLVPETDFDDDSDDYGGINDTCGIGDDDSIDKKIPSSSLNRLLMSQEEKDKTEFIDRNVVLLPVIIPVLAYFTYEDVAKWSGWIMDHLSTNKNWVSVDGGQYEAKILAPAINGIVISSISILFGTLISETITSLRQRQQDIRTNIYREAGELRILQAMVESFPPTKMYRERAISYLIQYCSRLIYECQPGIQTQKLFSSSPLLPSSRRTPTANILCGDSEMSGFLNQLNEMNTNNNKKERFSEAILAECYMSVSRLNSERSERISSFQSGFPPLHYGILIVLALTICFAFLLETNQDILLFLDAVKLRILWGMLVGVFSALGIVCYDLVDPFRGSYQINKSVDQLYTIRSAFRASAKLAKTTAAADASAAAPPPPN